MKGLSETKWNWVVGIVLVGVVMPLLAMLSSGWMKDKHGEYINRQHNEEYGEREAITRQVKEIFERQLGDIGQLTFTIPELTAAGPRFAVDSTFAALVQRTVEAFHREIGSAYQDVPLIVKGELRTAEGRNLQEWVSADEGFSPAEIADPDRNRIWNTHGFMIRDLHLYSRQGRNRYQYADVLRQYFPGDYLTAQDIAGNEVPIGLSGGLRVVVFRPETELPGSFYQVLAVILQRLGQLGIILLILTPPVWVYLDAKKRRLPAVLWALFTLFTSLIGLLIYALVTRESGPVCPECGERISKRFVVCPYCQTELRGTCPTCGQTVSLGWHYCPSCSTKL